MSFKLAYEVSPNDFLMKEQIFFLPIFLRFLIGNAHIPRPPSYMYRVLILMEGVHSQSVWFSQNIKRERLASLLGKVQSPSHPSEMNTDCFFTLWFLPVFSVFKTPSTCDPWHLGALFPLASNICSEHMFHTAYASIKLLLASLLCQRTVHYLSVWGLNFKCSTASWELKRGTSSNLIGEKLRISHPLRQNSTQGSHMSTVCLFIHVCVCCRVDYYPLPPCIKPPIIQCQRPDPNMAERQHVTCLAFHPRLCSPWAVVVVMVRCGGEYGGVLRCAGKVGVWVC